MNVTYKLYRNSGYLFFNSFSDKERYWVSILAAANGGGAMYAEITEQEFNEVSEGICEVGEFLSRFNRSWCPEKEKETEQTFNIDEAIDIHNLQQYASKPNKDGAYVPPKDPIKSIITVNKEV